MGQYYEFFMTSGRGSWSFPYRYAGEHYGYKLMETTGWCHNALTDYIAETLYDAKRCVRCANIGDYAASDAPGSACDKMEQYGDLFHNSREKPSVLVRRFNYRGKVFVNKTKRQFVRLDYCENTEEWTVNPITLLVAVGNGLGGGDYWGKNQNLVGYWAYDLVTIDDTVPDGYEDITEEPLFKESRA